ncbi:hypothetical protein TPL01_13220 [Sulfuriferula plumbiphila]|uniref:Uncharacterized protein n=1 Tax=Sulfuriferula plumbiphila TaxID=171865 RepID=A0A512L6S3_9PROT|nr:hypothetical protein [Sulfuriferula plumbiphila]BBP02949.1 hypothetical protein SFPGR_03710 [Sulfuriferula plumbiphila]GEP30184.1 hypothetical protein TPL01_13220 [Sulfuriferula plumbiphila]
MTNAIVAIKGNGAAWPTLLGQGPARISTGGKIRAGIKVLTKKAAENPKAKEIYDQGVAAGQSFEQIEKILSEALPNLKTPLVPKNVPWFTVRGQDFPNPEIAKQILDACGEDRGDGVKRLYRFPVVFPSDMWQAVMPHELAAWGASEKKFWSEYAPDGRVRYCKCYAPVPLDDTGKRVIRVFGGRKTTLRSENGGLCDPESCGEYQQRQCNLSGRFIFFIPGIKSISAFELHTNSFYAMNAAIQKFETIAFMRGGRISGFLDAKQTPFYITKKLMEVPHIDETGHAVRVKQWIIELDAPVDVTALLRANDDEETAIVNAQMASQILEGPATVGDAPHALAPIDMPATQIWPENGGNEVPVQSATARADSKSPQAPKTPSRTRVAGINSGPSLEQVIEAAHSYGIDAARYEEYADRRWGSGWKINAGGRRGALEELERYRNDPRGYLDKIDTELKVFS